MGYPIPANSPQITVGARTFAVAAWQWTLPIGGLYNKVAIYELQPGGTWNESARVGEYENAGDMLADVVAKGGIVKYISWAVAQINVAFVTLLGAQPAPVPPPILTEPTTDAEAVAHVNLMLASMKLTLVNGVPVLS